MVANFLTIFRGQRHSISARYAMNAPSAALFLSIFKVIQQPSECGVRMKIVKEYLNSESCDSKREVGNEKMKVSCGRNGIMCNFAGK